MYPKPPLMPEHDYDGGPGVEDSNPETTRDTYCCRTWESPGSSAHGIFGCRAWDFEHRIQPSHLSSGTASHAYETMGDIGTIAVSRNKDAEDMSRNSLRQVESS